MPKRRLNRSGTPFQQSINLRLNAPTDKSQLFAQLPGGEGEDIALSFFSIWISVPQGQSAQVYLMAPPDSLEENVDKKLWVPVVSQGTFGSMEIYVAARPVQFNYRVPNGGSTSPVPPINVSVLLSSPSTGTSSATAYFCGMIG